ncbi:MAG: GLUG motif-containing protein [Planctomycetota bacterium]
MLLVFVFVFGSAVFGQPWVGSGDANDPYQIWTAEDMQAIGADANYWDAHFVLMEDINLSAYTGTSFNIIGEVYYDSGWVVKPFRGVFDGRGHTVSNFTYDSNGVDYIGLFGWIDNPKAEIKNLGLIAPDVDAGNGNKIGSLVGRLQTGTIADCYVKDGDISGDYHVGGLVGLGGSTITHCHVTANVSGTAYVGGILGVNDTGEISNCQFSGVVLGRGSYSGGITGINRSRSRISNCYSNGSVSGLHGVGGITGGNFSGSISDGLVNKCFTFCDVTGDRQVGGLIGLNKADVLDSYSRGTVTANEAVGGLIGKNGGSILGYGEIVNCYSTGNVSGDSNTGGLVGLNDSGTVSDSFWDVNSSGQTDSDGGVGLPTVLMQTESTYTDAGWDFVTPVWNICKEPDYPKLWWEGCPVEVEVKLTPQMLNCASKGKWLKAHITLSEGYYPEDIDVNTPAIAEPMGIESEFIEVNEYSDGSFDVQIYFEREGFCEALSDTEDGLLEVTVTGFLTNGRKFEGSDTIGLKAQHRQRNHKGMH